MIALPENFKSCLPCALLGLLVCAIPILGYIAPRALAYAPAVLMILGFAAVYSANKQWPRIGPKALTIALSVTGLSLLSGFWAVNADEAMERSIKIALILIPGAIVFSQFRALNVKALPDFAKCFAVSVIMASVLLIIDLYTRAGPFFMLHDTDPDPDNFSNLNRSVVTTIFFTMAALFAVFKSEDTSAKAKRVFYALLGLCLAAIFFKTHSQSAQMGVIIAACMWFVFPARFKASWGLVALILTAGVLSAPWTVQIAYQHWAPAVYESAMMSDAYVASRLEIWDFVARKALESPFYGFGVEATRAINDFESAKQFMPLDHVLHPHNFALQIWIEFGALGAFMAVAFLNCVLYRIYKHGDAHERRFMLVIFLTLLSLAATSYGLWQGWWLGLFVLMAAYTVLLPLPEDNAAA